MIRFALCILLISLQAAQAAPPKQTGPKKLTLAKPFACADYGGNKICLVDAEGKITWQHPAANPQDVWLLPSGNILFSHIKGATEITLDREVVWKYETAKGNEVHACQPLPDGLVMVAESGPMQLVEVDRDGKVVKTVKLKTGQKATHHQMRCARKIASGNYLVGQYGDGVMREYGPNGEIVREIPQKMAFSGIRLPSGNTLMATGDSHRVVEIDADGKVVWEVNENDLPGNPLRFVAGLQRLPNGNTLICNWGGHGHVGQQPQIVEISPNKEVVGEIYDFDQFGTLSGVFLLGLEQDATQFEVLR